MLLGFLLCLPMFFCAVVTQDYRNKHYQVRNLLTLAMTLTVIVLFVLQHFVDFENGRFDLQAFDFFDSPWFYFALAINFVSHLTLRKCSKSNEANLVYVKYSNLFVVALTPVVAYAFSRHLGFDQTIKVAYNSVYEMLGFSVVLVLFAIAFLAGKVRSGAVNAPWLLAITVLSGTVAFVLTIKMMQTHDAEAYYLCTMVFNSAIWGYMALKNREVGQLQPRHWLAFGWIGLAYFVYSVLNVHLATHYAAEQVTVLRVAASMLVAAGFDAYNAKRWTMPIKDLALIGVLLAVMIWFTH